MATLFLSSVFPPLAAAGPPSPNILLIVADDIGVDHVGAYGEGTSVAPTPNIDALASAGVLFRNAWSNPVCSPTRATIVTGRYSFRTGIGAVINGGGFSLPASELTLPEALDLAPQLGYVHAAIGKWHLAPSDNPAAPNDAGFSYYKGVLGNPGGSERPEDYFRYVEVTQGVESDAEGYLTTREVDDALDWISAQSSPWLCCLFFHAVHRPEHAPPPSLHDRPLPPGPPHENPLPFYHAMVQAMDTEIGRLLAGLGSALDDTVVIFVGDNGTAGNVSVAPFTKEHAKATVFEGGVNVPLLIRGPGVVAPGREVAAVVNTTDLYATVLELAGVDLAATLPPELEHDSVSLVPYLSNPNQAPLRAYAFAEMFSPNGFAPTTADRVIRNHRYKLRRIGFDATQDQLYDLVADPFETNDLLANGVGSLPPAALSNYQSLAGQLDALLQS